MLVPLQLQSPTLPGTVPVKLAWGVGTMTEMEKSSREWHGETGYISKPMLLKYIGDLKLPIYYVDNYVDGPPAMVTAMRETLGEAGVDDDNIRTEEFSGY
jgi:Na+-transporting NADH:ubiquinone oxidoreductase subunit NqrF